MIGHQSGWAVGLGASGAALLAWQKKKVTEINSFRLPHEELLVDGRIQDGRKAGL